MIIMERIKITLIKSPIGYSEKQKRTAKGLGLKKMHQTVEHNATPSILGMVFKIRHLLKVEKVETSGPGGEK